MFTELKINDFRILKDKTFQIGKYITMLAGWNATGKSTVLALLANSSELKPEDGKTYNSKQFRAEFSEILKGSQTYDNSQVKKRLELIFDDNGEEISKTFRTTWQDNKTRFRVIPQGKDVTGKPTAAKFNIPVIYLGLSRLYPLGETEDAQLQECDQAFKNDQDRIWFIDNYQQILSIRENITEITNIDFKSTKKNTSGVSSDCYDWKTNSSGQDNISQILFAILSFKNLKKEKPADFKGGLLIIDELEATLHPKAQEKIIDLLIREAKGIGFQVVFTTHSLTIIERFSQKIKSNDGNIVSYYFTKPNDSLEVHQNLLFDAIKDDLLDTIYSANKPRKIIIYSEDEETRWFLKNILKGYLKNIQFLKTTLGCQELINLMNVEPSFSNYLVVFDGDLKHNDIKRIKKNKGNYLLLPVPNSAKYSPEKVLREFLRSSNATDYLSEQHKRIPQVNKRYFQDYDVKCNSDKSEREAYKEWFNLHKSLFNRSKIFDYWEQKNKDLVNAFRTSFVRKFNHIAEKLNIPKI
ncbi:putative ATPase [Candidatus Termititenax aidoneus]|uniref:ATPase n=1 Tax=Termititenax aidoneus TaxID=2218524 RepID=A0A388T7Z1_TERA1|nr:putative ATPase [Candidatus Termititenax aidoneus]